MSLARNSGPSRALHRPVLDDRLGGGQDVELVERGLQARSAVSGRAERDPLVDVLRVGLVGVVGRDQLGDVDEVAVLGRLSGALVRVMEPPGRVVAVATHRPRLLTRDRSGRGERPRRPARAGPRDRPHDGAGSSRRRGPRVASSAGDRLDSLPTSARRPWAALRERRGCATGIGDVRVPGGRRGRRAASAADGPSPARPPRGRIRAAGRAGTRRGAPVAPSRRRPKRRPSGRRRHGAAGGSGASSRSRWPPT